MDDLSKIMTHLSKLGFRARDRVTHAEGVIVSISFDLYGCVQAVLSLGLDKDGKLKDSMWFDVSRLEITSKKAVMDQPDFVTAGLVAEGRKGPAEKPANHRY